MMLSSLIKAQEGIGINTNEPKATLHVVSKPTGNPTSPQGIVFPHATSAERDSWLSVQKGTMFYNTDEQCIEVYNGTIWVNQCIPSLAIPSGITIGNGEHFTVSIYDNNYLPYTTPVSTASWETSNPDSGLESTIVDYQGTIPLTGIEVKIPITVTAAGVIPAYSVSVPVAKTKTQDSNAQNLTLSWGTQSVNTSTKFITAIIKPEMSALNIKKLDINAGLGNDYRGVQLAKFKYPKDNSGNTTSIFEVRVIPGIPDREFGKDGKHNFIYFPIVGPDGKVWLNNNLGADYANVNKTGVFNPAQQSTAKNDYHAYGSLFQWQRKADGHELINWTSSSTGGLPVITLATVSNPNWIAPDSKFIRSDTSPYGWVDNSINISTANKDLWRANKPNNPCPVGFHVPTSSEWDNIRTLVSDLWTNDTILKLPAVGMLNRLGNLEAVGTMGNYWTSEEFNSTSSISSQFNSASTISNSRSRVNGHSVRCIQD